jgi:hypothetical protein
MIENISKVPVGAFWIAQVISALLLIGTVTLAGRRYWKTGIAAALVCVAIGFVRGVPTHSSSVSVFAFTTIAMLAVSVGLLSQMGTLRRQYAEDPSRAVGELLTSSQQKRFTIIVSATVVVLFAGLAVSFGGFIGAKRGG